MRFFEEFYKCDICNASHYDLERFKHNEWCNVKSGMRIKKINMRQVEEEYNDDWGDPQ